MAALDLPLEYVRLGLRFDRLESGFVDAYTGDPRIRAQVADEPAPTPQVLRDQARGLLARAGRRRPAGRPGRLPPRAADRAGVHRPEDER